MKSRLLPLIGALTMLAGCGGLLETTVPAPQSYVLRPSPAAAPAATPAAPPASAAGSLLVQRPDTGPGLDTQRIVLLRTGYRFDFYAASQWAAPAPDMVAGAMVDALRTSGRFSAVFDDRSPYAPHYNLRCALRRFEADYSGAQAGAGSAAPTVHVALDCTLGRHRDRTLLGSFVAEGTAPSSDDRLGAVIAAFDAATQLAMQSLVQQVDAALSHETPSAN